MCGPDRIRTLGHSTGAKVSAFSTFSTAGGAEVVASKAGEATPGLCASVFVEGGYLEHLWAVATGLVGRKPSVKENLHIWYPY